MKKEKNSKEKPKKKRASEYEKKLKIYGSFGNAMGFLMTDYTFPKKTDE